MSDLKPGDTVTVTFQDEDHPGVIERNENGWIRCRIRIDPTTDYGSGTERLDPEQTVCVRADNIRKATQ